VFRPLRLIRAIITLLALGAVAQELSKPEHERTWHGRILGVPYDFRWPTLERFREAYWNPDDPRIFTDRVIGVGWAVNLAQLVPWLRQGLLEASRR